MPCSQILMDWQLAARSQFNMRDFKTIKAKKETGKRQPDANSPVFLKWHLTTGSQMPVRFLIFDGLRRLKLKRQPANGSQMLIY